MRAGRDTEYYSYEISHSRLPLDFIRVHIRILRFVAQYPPCEVNLNAIFLPYVALHTMPLNLNVCPRRMFKHLDSHQTDKVKDAMFLVEHEPGNVVIREGAR